MTAAITDIAMAPNQARTFRYRERGANCCGANPAALLNRMPSILLQLTLTSSGAAPVELGRYVLEHSATALA